ncbi:arginase [Parashewanella spongiae]|uniref:Arginase n=1 Tax=Parashewanella spongiae TaxID=342950 RepID=A0A3A6TZD9_9GAMM|nr:arginase family protein [Parashewanella spongiae]MCL1078475.1 arginase family protein [Parashewanella spongiae]RJY14618.1 arginase [Parashewanella spongiae]
MFWFRPYTKTTISSWINHRIGETRLGDTIHVLQDSQDLPKQLDKLKAQGVKFGLIGIVEDLGPKGNLGRGGAGDGFGAAVEQWVNLQSNTFLNGNECALLGEIHTQDLQPDDNNDVSAIRNSVAKIDVRVSQLIKLILAAGIEPIAIGGGHNNAYGLLKACYETHNQPVAAVNLDPHSDFRLKEGRHSGNGFSYAAAEGFLGFYHVLGLHELKNSAKNLEQLQQFGGSWHSFQQVWIRREISLLNALDEISTMVNNTTMKLGLELDLDAIENFPSSAMTAAGIPLLDAAHYVHHMAKYCDCQYLHLAEAAPSCHPISVENGRKQVGQSLCELIYAYVQGRLSR